MVSKRFVAAGLAAAAMTLIFGGCFGFFGLTFTKTDLKPGPPKRSKTVAKVRSQPLLTEGQKARGMDPLPNRDYPFFLIDRDRGVRLIASGARFDVPGKFGPRGGRRLVRDDALRDALAAFPPPICGEAFQNAPEFFIVLRTANRVRDRGKVKERTFSTLPFRQVVLANPYNAPGVDIQIGTWFDDGDGTPEPIEETIGCSGGGYFNLNLKDDPTALPPRDRGEARELVR